jgi:hypothetical protein
MIPDNVFIWVSFFLAQRPTTADFSSHPRCHSTWRNAHLMLKKFPGVFLCGEMIDWDAPTGGYLLQGSFATGTRAGKAAVSSGEA